ncbi:hypothetical protein HK098_003146 [Nowakowskiella sp. JEL0407]|nr:hypothetical protein HK098_003146 [Nowakowskiella sp. JEL0407]
MSNKHTSFSCCCGDKFSSISHVTSLNSLASSTSQILPDGIKPEISKFTSEIISTSTTIPTSVSAVEYTQTNVTKTFYKRTLPGTCISFSSKEGKELFKEALASQYMESYFSLSQQYLTQGEPAYCGLGTLCMVLNALEIDPGRVWKGPWRWFDESMLDCCRPLEDIKKDGVTLSEFACLARCNGLKAEVKRAHEVNREKFLEDIKIACRDPNNFMVVSYDRGTLGQTGTGHFSPIGGYNETNNMVLILDVARFKYPSYWVSVDILWESLQPHDTKTNKPRGYVMLEKAVQTFASTAISQLSLNQNTWYALLEVLTRELSERLSDKSVSSIHDLVIFIIKVIPEDLFSVVNGRLPFFIQLFEQFEAQTTASEPTDIITNSAHLIVHDPETKEASVQNMVDYVNHLENLLFYISNTKVYKILSGSDDFKRRVGGFKTEPVTVVSRKDEKNCCADTEEEKSRCQRGNSVLKELNSGDNGNEEVVFQQDAGKQDTSSTYLIQLYKSHSTTLTPKTFISLHPPSHNINDFNAFMTLFLYSILSTPKVLKNLVDNCDLSEDGREAFEGILKEAEEFVDREWEELPGVVKNEILFLRDQLGALSETVMDG